MAKRLQQQQMSRMHAPTRQDRLVVLLVSVGIFLVLLPLAQTIHPPIIGWMVMVIVVGLPVVAINVLLPFSRWPEDGSSTLIRNQKSRRNPGWDRAGT